MKLYYFADVKYGFLYQIDFSIVDNMDTHVHTRTEKENDAFNSKLHSFCCSALGVC